MSQSIVNTYKAFRTSDEIPPDTGPCVNGSEMATKELKDEKNRRELMMMTVPHL